MKKIYITFTFKGKSYKFSKPFTPGETTTHQWILDCYKSIGAKASQVHNRMMTHTGWNFWCGYIA